MKPSLLIATGCSWVAGKYIDADPTSYTFDIDRVEDPAFVKQHSFAGILQRKLGLDDIHFIADHGANNEDQVSQLVKYVDSHRDNYSRVFVLWGITSIYRWEMFSASINSTESCMVGRKYKSNELTAEVKNYFCQHWNKEYELKKVGTSIKLVNGYLDNLGIEHLFFNSFQSYTDQDFQIDGSDLDFYKIKECNNDLLSMVCIKNNIKPGRSKMPWLNLLRSKEFQFNTAEVKELQNTGWLDCATAHPTVKAHELIATELYDYIKEKNNERI